jgi:hypothetical protein
LRRHWAEKSPERRAEQGDKMRRGLVVAEVRRQIEKSRLEQGLPERVAAEQFLGELAAEVLGGGAA